MILSAGACHMTRLALSIAAILLSAPAFAAEDLAQDVSEEMRTTCAYQSQVVAAIQQARLDRVAEREVPEHILASGPEWPENYNTVIPLIAPWVYEQKRRVLRNEDLGAAWNELCIQQ
jgi:hypothetical protein